MMDGIYTKTLLTPGTGVVIQAVDGARPIIVGADGMPPGINLSDNCQLIGLWLGGTKGNQDRPIQMRSNCVLDGCTLFGYYGATVEGQNTDTIYQNNRFINCGTETLYHDIYISGDTRAKLYDNIHLGGEGYKIHLWHEEAHVDVQGNFCAEGFHALVMHHITDQAIDNIFWNHVSPDLAWVTVNISKGLFSHNLFGHRTFGTGKWDHQMNGGTDDEGLTVDSLGLIGDRYTDSETWPGYSIDVGPYNGDGHVLPAPGTNYTHYALTDLPTLLGYSEAQIDAAVAALISSFSANLQTIHDDATIETNFAILRACVTAWKAA